MICSYIFLYTHHIIRLMCQTKNRRIQIYLKHVLTGIYMRAESGGYAHSGNLYHHQPPHRKFGYSSKVHSHGGYFFFKCIAINGPAEQHRRSIHRNMYRCSSLHQEFVLCLVDVGDHSSYCCYFMGLQFQQ